VNELLGWRALFARALAAIRMRFSPVVPDCTECGFPVERGVPHRVTGTWWGKRTVKTWGDGFGHCLDCARVRAEAADLWEKTHPVTISAGTMQAVPAPQPVVRPTEFEHLAGMVKQHEITNQQYAIRTGGFSGYAIPGTAMPVNKVSNVCYFNNLLIPDSADGTGIYFPSTSRVKTYPDNAETDAERAYLERFKH
jgi:hypothetical protein